MNRAPEINAKTRWAVHLHETSFVHLGDTITYLLCGGFQGVAWVHCLYLLIEELRTGIEA